MSNQSSSPYFHFGGKGKKILFAHANGYPPAAYLQFFSHFEKAYEVYGYKARPLWNSPPPATSLKSWNVFGEDIIQFMDEMGMKKVIGMGHSMGGVNLIWAAYKRPDLFEQLVLLDPVILSYKNYLFTKFTPNSLLKKKFPMAKIATKRRNKWNSKQEVFELWRPKKVFKRFSDQGLKDLVVAAIVPNGDGVTLAFPREWEAQIYITAPYVLSKAINLSVPTAVIRAEIRSVIMEDIWDSWKTKAPNTQFFDFTKAGHLLPLEFPQQVAKLILTDIL